MLDVDATDGVLKIPFSSAVLFLQRSFKPPDAGRYGQHAGGMHSTGIQSCVKEVWIPEAQTFHSHHHHLQTFTGICLIIISEWHPLSHRLFWFFLVNRVLGDGLVDWLN